MKPYLPFFYLIINHYRFVIIPFILNKILNIVKKSNAMNSFCIVFSSIFISFFKKNGSRITNGKKYRPCIPLISPILDKSGTEKIKRKTENTKKLPIKKMEAAIILKYLSLLITCADAIDIIKYMLITGKIITEGTYAS